MTEDGSGAMEPPSEEEARYAKPDPRAGQRTDDGGAGLTVGKDSEAQTSSTKAVPLGARTRPDGQTIGQTVCETVCAAETGEFCCYGSPSPHRVSANALPTLSNSRAATAA